MNKQHYDAVVDEGEHVHTMGRDSFRTDVQRVGDRTAKCKTGKRLHG